MLRPATGDSHGETDVSIRFGSTGGDVDEDLVGDVVVVVAKVFGSVQFLLLSFMSVLMFSLFVVLSMSLRE